MDSFRVDKKFRRSPPTIFPPMMIPNVSKKNPFVSCLKFNYSKKEFRIQRKGKLSISIHSLSKPKLFNYLCPSSTDCPIYHHCNSHNVRWWRRPFSKPPPNYSVPKFLYPRHLVRINAMSGFPIERVVCPCHYVSSTTCQHDGFQLFRCTHLISTVIFVNFAVNLCPRNTLMVI
jgi:hypothetical protein